MSRARSNGDPRIRVVIDCDPGADDALALLAALAAPTFEVDFFTTVAGNAPIERTTATARNVATLAGREDISVYRGAAAPLIRPLDTGHEHLLTASTTQSPLGAEAGSAHDALGAWIKRPSGLPKRLIAIGPLTNIAKVLQHDPSALSDLDALYVMGGPLSRRGGRFSPIAETNFYLDPDAARLVMSSGAPIRLFDYDATRAVTFDNRAQATILTAAPEPLRVAMAGWFRALEAAQATQPGFNGIAIHDLCAVAGAAGIEPERWESVTIEVETGPNRGAVVAAPAVPTGPRVVQVARELDAVKIQRFLMDWLWRLPVARA